jgi:hypothetical protein
MKSFHHKLKDMFIEDAHFKDIDIFVNNSDITITATINGKQKTASCLGVANIYEGIFMAASELGQDLVENRAN